MLNDERLLEVVPLSYLSLLLTEDFHPCPSALSTHTHTLYRRAIDFTSITSLHSQLQVEEAPRSAQLAARCRAGHLTRGSALTLEGPRDGGVSGWCIAGAGGRCTVRDTALHPVTTRHPRDPPLGEFTEKTHNGPATKNKKKQKKKHVCASFSQRKGTNPFCLIRTLLRDSSRGRLQPN